MDGVRATDETQANQGHDVKHAHTHSDGQAYASASSVRYRHNTKANYLHDNRQTHNYL